MTTDRPLSITSTVDLPDGRHIYVSLELPSDGLANLLPGDLGEHTEVVQMAASGLLGHIRRMDQERSEKVPF